MSISVSCFIDLEWFSASPSDISGIKLASSRSSPIAFIITFLNSFMIKGQIQIVLGNVGHFLRTYVSLYIDILGWQYVPHPYQMHNQYKL